MKNLFILFTLFFSLAATAQKDLTIRVGSGGGTATPGGGTSTPQTNALATAYHTAIADNTYLSASAQFINELQAAGFTLGPTGKLKAYYPFLGGVASKTRFNIFSPYDADTSFRIVWGGTVTHSAAGVKGDGATGYGDTKFTPSVSWTKDNTGIMAVIADNVKNSSQVDMAARSLSTGQVYLNSSTTTQATAYMYGSTNQVTAQNASTHSSRGSWWLQRTSPTDLRVYNNGAQLATAAGTTDAQVLPTQPIYLLAQNNSGTSALWSTRLMKGAMISDGLTATEVATLQPIVERYLKATGKFYPNDLVPNRMILALGDSYTAGSNATVQDSSFISRLGAHFGQDVNNRGSGGGGAYAVADNMFSSLLSRTPSPYATVAMYGYNDLRRGGNNPKTLSKLEAAAHTVIVNSFAKRVVSVQDASVTKSNWATEQTFETYRYKYTTPAYKPISSTASGGTLSWNFTGPNVVVGAHVTADTYDAVNGPFTVHIDGVLKGTYDLRDKTDAIASNSDPNKTIPTALPFFDLGEGAHTIVITATTSTPATIDYLGTMYKAADCEAGVLFGEIAYMTAAGYATNPANATTPIMQAGTNAINAIISTYTAKGYPIGMFPTNSYLNLATDIDSDNVHPTNQGHRHIFEAILSVLQ